MTRDLGSVHPARICRPGSLPGRFFACGVAAAGLAGAILLPVASAAPATTTLVSRAGGSAGAIPNDRSLEPAISATGRFVSFTSAATNLDPLDGDPGFDVYVRDRQALVTRLVDRANGVDGAKAGAATQSSISGDGQRVVFVSPSPLDPADTDALNDIYVRDTLLNTTTLVSRASGPLGAKANAAAGNPAISPDGRYVAFDSFATNLDPDAATAGAEHVYMRDLATGIVVLVDRGGSSGVPGAGLSFKPSVAANASAIALQSNSALGRPGEAGGNAGFNIYRATGEPATSGSFRTRLVSYPGVGDARSRGIPDGRSYNPAISSDGKAVAYVSEASNLTPDDAESEPDVFVTDSLLGTTTLVSRANGEQGSNANSPSSSPSVSGDGRRVAFSSLASNLDAFDIRGDDVFVRDVRSNTTALVSRGTGIDGPPGDATSDTPAISADGTAVAFATGASNFDSSDTNGQFDVYVRELGVPTSPSPQSSPQPQPQPQPPPQPPSDRDGDGIADVQDRCPDQHARGRDANRNGCADYLRLKAAFKLTPGRYVRVAVTRSGRRYYMPLGVSVARLVASGLRKGAVVEVRCSRRACKTQKVKVRSSGDVAFPKLKRVKLRVGTRLTIRATQPGAVGVGATYRIKRNDLAKRSFCIRPDTRREGSCSSAR